MHLRGALEKGLITGPHYYCSGQMICITGGHSAAIGITADGPDGLRRAVRVQAGRGVDWVKFMATGGVLTRGGTPGMPHFNPDELKAGIEEAHKLKLKTAAHSQSLEGSRNAVRAGIDSLEHGIGLDEELVDEMAARGTFLIPTFCAPANIIKYGREAGIPAEYVEKTRRLLDEHTTGFQRAVRAGVRIALGTDAGTPFNHHGKNALELVLMAQNGLTPHQAICSAASGAAELLGIEDLAGGLSAGRTADFLVVDGNPLDDLSILGDPTRIEAVFISGRRIVDEIGFNRFNQN